MKNPFNKIQHFRFFNLDSQPSHSDYMPISRIRSGMFVRTRLYNYGREYRQKGLCLSFRSRYKFTGTVIIRSRPFSSDLYFPFSSPYIKFSVSGGDGIRTHGYSRNNNLASCHFKPLSHSRFLFFRVLRL